ncbi:4'-phosphopantetheinyl transferase superfamily protein [Mesorhizobium sp. M1004]|uniref:4'-phosphopantetheinyl transferase family protein n=1 Tax=Mesorhizobium sp. M1004 TaxID=2957046 RepID=UPI003336C330
MSMRFLCMAGSISSATRKICFISSPWPSPQLVHGTTVTPCRISDRSRDDAAWQALGQLTTEIPIGPDRAPVWPKGSVGSITHARGHCACFAKGDPGWQAGVDIEAIASGHPLESILSMTANQRERALIARQTALPPDRLATLLFSAKETLFKGLYPVVRRFLDSTVLNYGRPCERMLAAAPNTNPLQGITCGRIL